MKVASGPRSAGSSVSEPHCADVAAGRFGVVGAMDRPDPPTSFIVAGCSVPTSRVGAGSCFVSTGLLSAASAAPLAITFFNFNIFFRDYRKIEKKEGKKKEKRKEEPANPGRARFASGVGGAKGHRNRGGRSVVGEIQEAIFEEKSSGFF